MKKECVDMKLSKGVLFNGALSIILITISLTGFYIASVPYLAPEYQHIRRFLSGMLNGRENQRGSDINVDHLLPERWEAEWRNGTLCVTHNNADGALADFHVFNNIDSFYIWFDMHPDFCDLDVDKVARSILIADSEKKSVVRYSTPALENRFDR